MCCLRQIRFENNGWQRFAIDTVQNDFSIKNNLKKKKHWANPRDLLDPCARTVMKLIIVPLHLTFFCFFGLNLKEAALSTFQESFYFFFMQKDCGVVAPRRGCQLETPNFIKTKSNQIICTWSWLDWSWYNAQTLHINVFFIIFKL